MHGQQIQSECWPGCDVGVVETSMLTSPSWPALMPSFSCCNLSQGGYHCKSGSREMVWLLGEMALVGSQREYGWCMEGVRQEQWSGIIVWEAQNNAKVGNMAKSPKKRPSR